MAALSLCRSMESGAGRRGRWGSGARRSRQYFIGEVDDEEPKEGEFMLDTSNRVGVLTGETCAAVTDGRTRR